MELRITVPKSALFLVKFFSLRGAFPKGVLLSCGVEERKMSLKGLILRSDGSCEKKKYLGMRSGGDVGVSSLMD